MRKRPSTTNDPTDASGSGSEFSDGSNHRHSRETHAALHHSSASDSNSKIDKEPYIRRDRKKIPRLRIPRNTDAAMQMDKFDQGLNQVETAIAVWSNDAEEYRSNAVKAAKEADALFTAKALAARAFSGGSGSRLLGLRMPTKVPILEEILQTDRGEALPGHVEREGHDQGPGQHCGLADVGHANHLAL